MQTPPPSPYRTGPGTSPTPTHAIRVYFTPGGQLTTEVVLLVLALGAATIGAPIAPLLVLMLLALVATRRFIVVDRARGELRVMAMHPSFGPCSLRAPLDRAVVGAKPRVVREIVKRNGRIVGQSDRIEYDVFVNERSVSKTRSGRFADELVGQLRFAMDREASGPLPSQQLTSTLNLARCAVTALTMGALVGFPLSSGGDLARSFGATFRFDAMRGAGEAASLIALVILSLALAIRVARAIAHPCDAAAQRRAPLVVGALSAVLAIGSAGAFFATKQVAEARQQARVEEQMESIRRRYGPGSAEYVAPSPPRPELPTQAPPADLTNARCGDLTSDEAFRRLVAAGLDATPVTLIQPGDPLAWSIVVRVREVEVRLQWFSLDLSDVSGELAPGRLTIVRGPNARRRQAILRAHSRATTPDLMQLMRTLGMQPQFTNATAVRGTDRTGLYWLSTMAQSDRWAVWVQAERTLLAATAYGRSAAADTDAADAWARYAASLLCRAP